MDEELDLQRALQLIDKIRIVESEINKLSDEIHDLEESREVLTTLNAKLASAKYTLDCEQATYDRLTRELSDFTKSCKRTLNPSVIIEQLGKKWAIVEQQKEAKVALKEAKRQYETLASDIKKINDTYGDMSATIEQKKKEYCDIVSSYNAHVSTFIPYTKFTPTLIDPSVVRRINPFPMPQDIMEGNGTDELY